MNDAVLITGGARRIGRGLALGFASLGYGVGIHCLQSREEARALQDEIRGGGGAAEIFTADLKKPDEIERLMDEAFGAMGSLTTLINNASLFKKDDFAALTPSLWQEQMAVNLAAPVFLSQAFAKRFPQGAKGAIINLVDEKVMRLDPYFFSYTLSKSALWSATRMMSQALAPAIRVNAIAPGGVLPDAYRDREALESMGAALPLGRVASVDDIWRAVRFILETPSLTGQMLAIDGGAHLGWKNMEAKDVKTP